MFSFLFCDALSSDFEGRSSRNLGAPGTRFAARVADDAGNGTRKMTAVTYYVVFGFMGSADGDIVVTEPKGARSTDDSIRMVKSWATTKPRCGAIAFSRTDDPAAGDFEDAVIVKTIGEVNEGLPRPTV